MIVLYILLALLLFGIVIAIHELGHFLTAKLFHVHILEFSIGMGPKVFSRVGKDGVKYALRAFPIGGYLSMVGEDGDGEPPAREDDPVERESPADDPDSFAKKPVWQRMIILAAGAAMNILLGFALMAGLVACSDALYGTTVDSLLVSHDGKTAYVAETAGFPITSGDTILKIGSRKINVREDILYEVMFLADKPVDVTVRRGGETLVLRDVVFPTFVEDGKVFGNAGFLIMKTLPKTLPSVAKQAVCQSLSTLKLLVSTILDTFRGKYGMDAFSGPVGIVGTVAETAAYGFDSLIFLMAIITLNLGVFNLLPLPALDGGRLLFLLIELVIRRPVPAKYERAIHAAGFVLLIGLALLITYQDVVRIFFK